MVDYFIGDVNVISNMNERTVEPPICDSKHAPMSSKFKLHKSPEICYENMIVTSGERDDTFVCNKGHRFCNECMT